MTRSDRPRCAPSSRRPQPRLWARRASSGPPRRLHIGAHGPHDDLTTSLTAVAGQIRARRESAVSFRGDDEAIQGRGYGDSEAGHLVGTHGPGAGVVPRQRSKGRLWGDGVAPARTRLRGGWPGLGLQLGQGRRMQPPSVVACGRLRLWLGAPVSASVRV
eukprot:scaffold88320_cov54-Phaeocystis_antarctica.AAC.3